MDKKRAVLKAKTEKRCQCTAPREYQLMKEVVGNDLEAFNARMQADRNFAMATAKTLTEKKRQIDNLCAK